MAVAAFLERRLRFTGIAEVIERAMDEFERASPDVKSLRPNPSSGSSGARPGLGIGKIGIVTNLWAFLFVLGVLIFVHELGHFLMARRLGVRVLTFSLGFGPKLLKFTRGDTEYAISAIPLGGYVKMAGENPDEARSGRPDEFLSKTKWERFLGSTSWVRR